MNFIEREENPGKLAPSKIVCVGRNYVEHIEELGNEKPENMVLFNKPNSSITNRLFYFGKDTRFECELSLLTENGEVSGLGIGLDLTHAAIQNRLKKAGLPWERAKAFDGSAVLSRFVAIEKIPEHIVFELYLNGKLVQRGDSEQMIYGIEEIVREIKTFMTLENGDVIMSGTPKGVGTYNISDRFDAILFIDGKKTLECSWEAEKI